MKKNIVRALWILLWAAALLLRGAASLIPGFAEWYAVTVYPKLVKAVGGFLGQLPFSAAEILAYLGILTLVIWLLRSLKRLLTGKKKGEKISRWQQLCHMGTVVMLWGGILFLTYMLGCGINYHRMTFSQRENLPVSGATREELDTFCQAMVYLVNHAAAELPVDSEGSWQLSSRAPEQARAAMNRLGEHYDSLSGFYPLPKGVLISRWMTVQQITGIYSPFTMEANFNREVPEHEKAFSICHELSHLKGFMREDEANFVAWLACMASDEPELCYSGALMGFVYAGNALARYDRDRYWQIREGLCRVAASDLAFQSAFWKQYDGKVAETHEKVNDIYLKANAQRDGVESYGRMVELMLAFVREQKSR